MWSNRFSVFLYISYLQKKKLRKVSELDFAGFGFTLSITVRFLFTLCEFYIIVLQYKSNIIKCLWELLFNCNNMNFIWKNSLFENINSSSNLTVARLKLHLIYTLNSSIIYVNKNKFIIVYNSLFCFLSTSTHDDSSEQKLREIQIFLITETFISLKNPPTALKLEESSWHRVHTLNVPLQLSTYCMEQLSKTKNRKL